MEIIRYKIHSQNPQLRVIRQTVERLNAGGLIIYPTDTVYGIGCSLFQKNAIERIYKLKGKSKFDPMSIICHSIQQAAQYSRISNFAFRILKRLFPGPYTVILEATREIPKLMLSKRKEVGIRIPDNVVCQTLVEELGHPLLNTSVNVQGDELLNDPEEIFQRFRYSVDIFLDTGPLPDAEESTVISLIGDQIEIIREGKGPTDILFL